MVMPPLHVATNLVAAVAISINPTKITHIPNPLYMGCHFDSGYVHATRGMYSQLVLDESFEVRRFGYA
jgi:hypothetical protein